MNHNLTKIHELMNLLGTTPLNPLEVEPLEIDSLIAEANNVLLEKISGNITSIEAKTRIKEIFSNSDSKQSA